MDSNFTTRRGGVALRALGKGSGVAFAWQDKRALRAIRERLDGEHQTSALAVYVALTELASNAQREMFTAPMATVAATAGVSVATVKRVLKILEDIPVIQVRRPALKAPSEYVLLAMVHGEPTIAHREPTIAQTTKRVRRATLEESLEERIEQRVEDFGAEISAPPHAAPKQDEVDLSEVGSCGYDDGPGSLEAQAFFRLLTCDQDWRRKLPVRKPEWGARVADCVATVIECLDELDRAKSNHPVKDPWAWLEATYIRKCGG